MINTELVIEKYQDMKGQGLSEDYLDKVTFGDIKVFINSEPLVSMFSVPFEDDIIYVGSNEEIL